MKTISPRALGSQCVIVAALFAGGSLAVLGPMKDKLAEAQHAVEECRQVAARAGAIAADAPRIMRLERDAEVDRKRVIALSEAASDTARLNDLIGALATECGVDVQRTQPKEQPAPVTAAAAPVADGAVEPPKDPVPNRSIAVNIDVSGSWIAMNRFIEALENRTGFARLASIRVTPGEEHQDIVRASIQSMHFAFKIPEATVSAGGTPVVAAPVTEGAAR